MGHGTNYSLPSPRDHVREATARIVLTDGAMLRLHLLNLLRLMLFATILGLTGSSPSTAHAAVPMAGPFAVALQGQVNLNTATAEQLDLLPGVGPATAAKIIAYRDKRPFQSVRQLLRIKGIGPKRLEAMLPYLVLEGETTLQPVPS
jgi:competence protein ComEA